MATSATRQTHEADQQLFEAHLVTQILARLSAANAADRAREGSVDVGEDTGGPRLDGRGSDGEVLPRALPPGRSGGEAVGLPATLREQLKAVIKEAVGVTIRDVGAPSPAADPAIQRLTEVIERSLPRARREASEATIEKMVGALVETQDPIAQASAAIDAGNARARHRFMSEVATLTADEVAQHFGSTARNRHQLTSRWKRQGRVLSVPWQGLERYPAFQFKEGRPLTVIGDVLKALPGRMSAWERAFWFVSTNGWLDGAAPHERLGDPDRVIAAARAEGEAVVG